MNDSEEYEQLEKEEEKIREKLRGEVLDDEEVKLCSELDKIRRRKTRIRNRM